MFTVLVEYNNKYFFFPKYDFKLRGWLSPLKSDVKIVTAKTSIYVFLCKAVFAIITGRAIFIFRYINIQNNLIKECVKYLTIWPLFLLAQFNFVEIRWILHNIDKETHERYHWLVKVYRRQLYRRCNVLYLTTKRFARYVDMNFLGRNSSIDFITFGSNEVFEISTDSALISQIERFRLSLIDLHGSEVKVGLVVAFSRKNMQIVQGMNYLLKNYHGKLGFVIFSDLEDFSDIPEVLQYNQRLPFSESAIEKYIDFSYKELDDISLPYTLYSSAYSSIPIFTSANSPFHEEIIYWEIGGVIGSENNFIDELNRDRSNYFKRFRASNNWKIASRRIFHV